MFVLTQLLRLCNVSCQAVYIKLPSAPSWDRFVTRKISSKDNFVVSKPWIRSCLRILLFRCEYDSRQSISRRRPIVFCPYSVQVYLLFRSKIISGKVLCSSPAKHPQSLTASFLALSLCPHGIAGICVFVGLNELY